MGCLRRPETSETLKQSTKRIEEQAESQKRRGKGMKGSFVFFLQQAGVNPLLLLLAERERGAEKGWARGNYRKVFTSIKCLFYWDF